MSVERKKQSIVTKIGDKGYTYVYSGLKLSKDDLRLEVVGTMYELSSSLGIAKSFIKDKDSKDVLGKIQNDLFIVGSQIPGLGSKNSKLKISFRNIRYLENRIEELERKFPCFYLYL